MAQRKKLITYKNFLTVQTFYAKRHSVFVKKPFGGQYCQQGFRRLGKRWSRASYLLFTLTPGRLKPDHLDSFNKVLVRKFSRLFRLWTVIRFTEMVTAKPNEIRMGKGKGAFSFWSRSVPGGFPLLEIGFIRWLPQTFVFHIIRRLRAKFPVIISLRF